MLLTEASLGLAGILLFWLVAIVTARLRRAATPPPALVSVRNPR
ncbi:MAG: hypothetical protein WDN69_22740 [Aliidongia sp.]